MPLRILLFLLLFPLAASAEDRLAEYYQRTLPTVERFVQNVEQTDFTIFTLFNNIAIIVSANVDLPEAQRPAMATATRLLRIAEEMQDKNPESRTFGNFRWYWNSTGVTDANAAEFALARMLSISLDTPEPLSEEDRNILRRLFERAVHVCMNRRIRPDYTNIAFYNAVHLILVGQILDRPEVTQEGKDRLQNIVAHIWDHGVFEYNSPAYYHINVDSLQLALRHVNDEQTQQTILALLELFWTDMSLHWYTPGLRLAGAQSRTYDYLFGTPDNMNRIFSFAGLAPFDHRARYHAVLNSFRALYQPPPEIVQLNELYPRGITRNWGREPGQWAALYMFEDIALGTAGAKYDAQQNMVQTVDIADHLAGTPAGEPEYRLNARSYFIADGREDPYGTKLYSTGSGGQQKALHLDALWFGAQRSVDSLGIVLYPPEAVAEPVVINVQSHFVIRKPESILLAASPCEVVTLLPNQPVKIGGQAVIFRYKTCAFGIRAVWTRDKHGQPAEVYLVDDGNEHDVYRLTVEHGAPHLAGTPAFPGAAFWLRIGSRLETDEQFTAWQQQFITAKVNRLEVKENDIDIEVAGQNGIVSVSLAYATGSVNTEPAAPLGILTLNGKDLGRPILEKLPAVAKFVKQRDEAEPIIVQPSGTYWTAASGYSWNPLAASPCEALTENQRAGDYVAGALTINHDVSWQLQIAQPGEYELWGRVQTMDAQHDSFFVESAKRLPDGSFMRRSLPREIPPREPSSRDIPPRELPISDLPPREPGTVSPIAWHLGVREHWTWVRLPVPIHLDEGIWQLTLSPREYEGRIVQLFLTMEGAKP